MTQFMMTEYYLWDFRFSHQYCKYSSLVECDTVS